MIYLITALPGVGKSLLTIDRVIDDRKKFEDEHNKTRNVYYFNLDFDTEHALYNKVQDWQAVTAQDLTEDLPKLYNDEHPTIKHGSIILIDEAQDVYPQRTKAVVPEYLKFFEKHRHTGCDFYVITQKIRQIDIHLRSLVGEHWDMKRVMGRDLVSIKSLNRIMEGDDEKSPEIQTSQKKYPKHLYGLYKSAVLHTHKKKLPLKLTLGVPALFALICGMAYLLYSILFADDSSLQQNNQVTEADLKKPMQTINSKPIKFNVSDSLFVVGEMVYQDQIKPFFQLVVSNPEEREKAFYSLTLEDLVLMGMTVKRLSQYRYLVDDQLVMTRPKTDYPRDYHIDQNQKRDSNSRRNKSVEPLGSVGGASVGE